MEGTRRGEGLALRLSLLPLNVTLGRNACFPPIEAMLSGCCAFLSDCPGNVDVVVDGKTGVLFDSVDGAVSKILRALEFPSECQDIATAGREHCCERYSLERYVRDFEQLFLGWENTMKTAVLFGGSGFIGSHFSQYLLDNQIVEKVIAADIAPLGEDRTTTAYKAYVRQSRIEFLEADVRKAIRLELSGDVVLVANLAAVHREPGHEPFEYYTTNLLGAENVCAWTGLVGCNQLIFTSSIAPYGPSEEVRTESSVPVPETAYGCSKLAAEHIHRAWQAERKADRRLVIVRPGVVFGAGEGGNVTRLVKATIQRYFLYMGNRDTRKAGAYVKELCNAMYWALANKAGTEPVLFNMSMNPGPTIQEYVETVCEVEGIKRFVPSVPYAVIYPSSFVAEGVAKLLRINNQPISPVRIRKLVRSNNILPTYLAEHGYQYLYTFREAMEDWRKDRPEDWSKPG